MRWNIDPQSLAETILQGDRLALARACTEVENDTAAGEQVISTLFQKSGKAHLVGITGSPGTGKSSIVNQVAREYRLRHPDSRVAIIAVDPTSPFSGGAVLGDRVRMRDLVGDEQVFIRSMATRGALGGLSRQTTALALLFDCAGYELVIIETVGAGQSEVDIVRLAHTTIVVEAPGLGDDIQAIKAGIMEIADILVVNKADHPGVEATERALRSMLEMAQGRIRINTGHHGGELGMTGKSIQTSPAVAWMPSVLRTVAIENKGTREVVDEIARHRVWMEINGRWSAKEHLRLRSDLVNRLKDQLFDHWLGKFTESQLEGMVEQVMARKKSPYQAASELLSKV